MEILPPTVPGVPMDVPAPVTRKHPDAHCEDCPLFDSGAFAPGVGSINAELVILGEAPGYQEAKTGTPFTGPSGKLLDTVLVHHGLDRSAAYVDNIVACRPPDNRTPSAVEIKACYPRVQAEIAKRPVKQILTLGNTATQAVLDTKDGITVTRVGPPKLLPQGVEVVATFHPAACLRQGDLFPHLVNDVGKLKGTFKTNWEEPKYIVYDTEEGAQRALRELLESYRTYVLDIEVGIEKDSGFDHPDHFELLCVGIAFAPGKAAVIGENACKSPTVRQLLKRLLEDPTKRLVAHNGKFDLAGLRSIGRGTLWFDTMVASYCLDERQGTHGLKYLATETLGAPDYSADIKRFVGPHDSYAVVPRDHLYKYNAYDVVCTWALMEIYATSLEEQGLRGLHDHLVDVSNALINVEMTGVKIDMDRLDYLTEHYLDSLETLEEELKPWVNNPRSPKQVKEALAEMGFVVASTDKDTLEELIKRLHPEGSEMKFVQLMLQARKEQKLYGTYVKGARKRLYQGRLHPTFLVHGTTTGRLSCRNPNLQNVPRGDTIRSMFVPEEGNVFVQADYSTIELRVSATLAQDEFLANIFREGRDIHDEFSLMLYGSDFTKEQRIRTKAFVYGTNYGREAFSIAQEYDIPVSEAVEAQNKFLELIPGIVQWRDNLRHTLLTEQEDIVTHFGRHRRFWLITNENLKDTIKEAYAYVPQSTANDINLLAMVELCKRGFRVRIPVHDSILVECGEDQADDVAAEMVQVMSTTAVEKFSDFVPFPVEVKYGKNWGEV